MSSAVALAAGDAGVSLPPAPPPALAPLPAPSPTLAPLTPSTAPPGPAAVNADPLAELSASDRARLSAGQIVVSDDRGQNAAGETVGRARGWVLVHAPWERCWDIMTDYPRQPQFMPRLERTVTHSRDDNEAAVEHHVKVAFADVEYTLRQQFRRAERMVRFDLVRERPHDLRDTSGFWRFTPTADGTIVDFAVYVDAGFFIPDFIQRWLARRDLPELMTNVRKRIESGGTWRKSED